MTWQVQVQLGMPPSLVRMQLQIRTALLLIWLAASARARHLGPGKELGPGNPCGRPRWSPELLVSA